MQDHDRAARTLAEARIRLAITQLSDDSDKWLKRLMLAEWKRKVAQLAEHVEPVSASHWGMWER